ncbi:MAG: type II toxin-antitoxin system MqsA family antitoxin [Magnetococcales bacterium]|nr:type II toxin-antitoxin system MqsA family antitoxin [Magnetococcales bacterium]
MKTPVCHLCAQVMERSERATEIHYRGETTTINLPGWYCRCGESTHDSADMVVSDHALNLLKARTNGLLEPDHIAKIRKRLKLSQRKAGEILGGGPNAFHKYEKGKILVSKAISNLLKILDHDPKALQLLESKKGSI